MFVFVYLDRSVFFDFRYIPHIRSRLFDTSTERDHGRWQWQRQHTYIFIDDQIKVLLYKLQIAS